MRQRINKGLVKFLAGTFLAARWVNRHKSSVPPVIAVILSVIIVIGLGKIVDRQHQSNLESCYRGNDSRVSNIHNLRGDVHTLKAELALWEAAKAQTPKAQFEASPPAIRNAFDNDIAALKLGIHRKEHAVRSSIRAQAPVAVHKGSAVIDCAKAFP